MPEGVSPKRWWHRTLDGVVLLAWTAYLFSYWALGLPLGPGSPYVYPAP
jgi:hypothetical protein